MKVNDAYSNIVANILPIDPTLPVAGVRSNDKNSTFTELGHVAYQIKANDECSNMQAHILSLHTLDPWGGVKG